MIDGKESLFPTMEHPRQKKNSTSLIVVASEGGAISQPGIGTI